MERKLLLLRRSWWFAGKPQQLRLVRAVGPVMIFHFSFPTFLCVVADAVIFLLNFSYIFIFFFLPHSTFLSLSLLRECDLYVHFPARVTYRDEIFMFSSSLRPFEDWIIERLTRAGWDPMLVMIFEIEIIGALPRG